MDTVIGYIFHQLTEYLPTWAVVLGLAGYATKRFVVDPLEKMGKRQDNHEDILVYMGATKVERTDGSSILHWEHTPIPPVNGRRRP